MKVLDASFLIDYLDGVEATRAFYRAHGGPEERWVMPVVAYAEVLVGEGNLPGGDIGGARDALAWTDPYAADERTAVIAGEIAAEIGPEGPYLDGPDALVAATGRELDAPVVSSGGDLTHEATTRAVDVLEYR